MTRHDDGSSTDLEAREVRCRSCDLVDRVGLGTDAQALQHVHDSISQHLRAVHATASVILPIPPRQRQRQRQRWPRHDTTTHDTRRDQHGITRHGTFSGVAGEALRLRVDIATQRWRNAAGPEGPTDLMTLAMAGMARCSTSTCRAGGCVDRQQNIRDAMRRISSDAKSDMTRRVKDHTTWADRRHSEHRHIAS
jgi:hypothetical protein